MSIEISVTGKEAASAMLNDFPKQIPKVLSRALNRANKAAETAAKREVADKYTLSRATVSATLKLKGATAGNLTAELRSTGGVMPVTKYKASQTGAGVEVQIKKGGGGLITSAFIANLRSGHVGAFNRTGSSRLPIKERYGPSIPSILGTEPVSAVIQEKAVETFDKRLDHEVSAVLGGYV